MDLKRHVLLLFYFREFRLLHSKISFAAIGLEKTQKHRSMDAVLPNLQEQKAALSMGSACWASGQFQSRTGPGYDFEEAMRQRGKVF